MGDAKVDGTAFLGHFILPAFTCGLCQNRATFFHPLGYAFTSCPAFVLTPFIALRVSMMRSAWAAKFTIGGRSAG